MRFISEGRMKLVILFSLLTTVVFAEPPVPSPYGRIALRVPSSSSQEASSIVNQRLLNRVADIISQGGDGSEQNNPQENEGFRLVDSELFDRIARIINQNEEQTSGFAAATSAPSLNSNQPENLPNAAYGTPAAGVHIAYGAPPPPQVRKLARTIELGRPELARRIASFDFQDEEENSLSSGYSGPSSSYSSDSYTSSLPAGGALGRIQFISAPQTAERIAAFDITESPNNQQSPQTQGGYQNQ